MQVGILPGDLQPQVGFRRRVIRQRAENVRAAAQRDAARRRRSQGVRHFRGKIIRQFHVIQRGEADAQRLRQPRVRVIAFGLRGGQIELRLVQRNLREGQLRPGNGPGIKPLLQQFYNFRLRGELFLQQRGAASAHLEIEQGVAHVAANLPRRHDEIPTRGLRDLFSLSDALAAFTGGFDGHVKRQRNQPRTVVAGNLRVVAGRKGDGRVWAARPPSARRPSATRHCARATSRSG